VSSLVRSRRGTPVSRSVLEFCKNIGFLARVKPVGCCTSGNLAGPGQTNFNLA